jgi:hypothetical protein
MCRAGWVSRCPFFSPPGGSNRQAEGSEKDGSYMPVPTSPSQRIPLGDVRSIGRRKPAARASVSTRHDTPHALGMDQ